MEFIRRKEIEIYRANLAAVVAEQAIEERWSSAKLTAVTQDCAAHLTALEQRAPFIDEVLATINQADLRYRMMKDIRISSAFFERVRDELSEEVLQNGGENLRGKVEKLAYTTAGEFEYYLRDVLGWEELKDKLTGPSHGPKDLIPGVIVALFSTLLNATQTSRKSEERKDFVLELGRELEALKGKFSWAKQEQQRDVKSRVKPQGHER